MNLFENFNFDRFLFSLKYMWQGMLCIFIVIGVIVLSVMLMNYLGSRAEERKEENDNGR